MPAPGTPVRYQTTAALAQGYADAGAPVVPSGVLPAFVTADKGTKSDLVVAFSDGSWHRVPDVDNTALVP